MERKNKLRMELEQKLLEEEMLRQEAEVCLSIYMQSKCKNLEEEEIEILKRIKTTTQVHKAGNIFLILFSC